MSQVKVEFIIKGGDKVITTNKEIIKQLVDQNAQYNVLEGNIDDLIKSQEEQTKSTNDLAKSYSDVLKQYKENEKELKALAIAGDTTSERYQELSKSVGQARAALEDVSKEANINKGAFDATIGSLSGVSAGFTSITGALGLLGAESESVQKAILKVQSALALSQGLDSFQKAIPAFKSLTTIVGTNLVAAFGTLRNAIIATGIGAAAVAIGLIVANWERLRDIITGTNLSIEEQNSLLETNQVILDNSNALLEAQLENLELQGLETDDLRIKIENNLKLQIEALKIEILKLETLRKQTIEENKTLSFWEKVKFQALGILGIQAQTSFLVKNAIKDQEDIAKIDADILETKTKILNIENSILKVRKSNTNNTNNEIEDQTLRLRLVEDGLVKDLELLELKYKKEQEDAKGNKDKLLILEQIYNKEYNKIVEQFFLTYGDVINKNNNEYSKLMFGFYTNEINSLKLSNEEKLKEINEFYNQDLFFLNTLLTKKEISQEEYNQELINSNKILNDQLLTLTINFEKQKADLSRKLLIDNLKAIIDLTTELEIENFEQRKKLFENEFALFKEQELLRLRDAKNINEELLRGEIELINKSLDEAEKAYGKDSEIYIKREKEKNDLVLELNKLTNTSIEELYKVQLSLLDEIFIKRLKNLELENELSKVDNKFNDFTLKRELAYYNALNSITESNVLKRREIEKNINEQYDKQELQRQIGLMDKKLEITKGILGEESDEYQKILLERAKLINKLSQSEDKDLIDRQERIRQIFQQLLTTIAEVGAAIDSYYEAQAAKTNAFYDNEIKKSEDARNVEVNNYALTTQEKSNIDSRYALEQTAIEEKRAAELKNIEKKRADAAFAIQIAQIIGNTALAISAAIAASPLTVGMPFTALIGAAGLAQLVAATNQRTVVRQLEQGGLLSGPSHAQGGIPVGNTGIEVEGNEAVINKRSTAMFLPELSAINVAGGGVPLIPNTRSFMQSGGMLSDIAQTMPSMVVKTYVVSEEITNKQAMDKRIKRQARY